jgi:DNA-binding transcriptional ArsR family regulator
MNQKQIVAETLLSKRTVKHAIKNLKEKGFIREKRDFNDLRRKYYAVKRGKICLYDNFNSLGTIHRRVREKDV